MNQLIETSDFDVGPWRVRPSRSQLQADGGPVRVEPRVMGVLVALNRRRGETVAREQLITEVWDGRVVTDDAVQRCIAALRKVLRSRPGADIETIPRLGYVLRVSEAATRHDDSSAARRDDSSAHSGVRVSSVSTALMRSQGADQRFRSWLLPVVGVFFAVGAALWWMSADIPASSGSAARHPRAVPFTALRGRETQPALSPSGGQVAFVWSGEDGGNADIYVKAVNTDGLLRLTDDPARDLHPAWSPDGGEIAFVRLSNDGSLVMRMPAIGGTQRRIASFEPSQVRALDWSTEGTRIAIALASDDLAPARLHLIDIESGEMHTPPAIEALRPGIEDARFSPDGSLLAFSAGGALGVEDVYLYRFADRALTRLTFDQLKVHNLDWSADGRAIVFSSNRGGPFRLWEVPIAGGASALVAGAGDSADDPSVAANGRIVYEVWREDAEIVRFDLEQPQAAPRPVLASTRFEWDAKVAPDGRRIAYVSDQSGAAEVWMAARDGSAAQRLTSFAGPYTHSPRWSPDGARLAFVAPVSGRMNLFVLGLDDGRPRRIGAGDVDYFAPAWLPDGSAVIAGGRRVVAHPAQAEAANGASSGAAPIEEEHVIWRVPLGSGSATRLGPIGARTAQVSPDGAFLYFTRVGVPGLWRRALSESGDAAELLLSDLTPVDWNNWLVTSRAVFYVRRAAYREPELMRLDLDSRAARVVRPLPGLLYKSGLWVSPDERELVATVVLAAEADLHMLDPGGATRR